jgi:hypothetical protein
MLANQQLAAHQLHQMQQCLLQQQPALQQQQPLPAPPAYAQQAPLPVAPAPLVQPLPAPTLVDRNKARRELRVEARAQTDALCKAVEANISCTNPQLPASVEKLATSAATLIAKQMATADVSGLTALVEQAGLTRDEHQREELMEKILTEADRIQDNGMSNVDTVTNQICTLVCQVLTLKRCF